MGSKKQLLDSLLPPHLRQHFMSNVWGKQHLIWKSDFHLQCALKINDIKEIIKTSDMNYPEVSCLSKNGVLNPEHYVSHFNTEKSVSVIEPSKLMDQLNHGNTLRFKEFYTYHQPWVFLKESLARIFSCPISLNVYLSHQAEGIKPHFDVHHIFIVQLEGVKTWHIGPISKQFPRYDFAPGAGMSFPEEICDVIELHPGDIMYLPIGLWHKTSTLNESLHLAIGILSPDWTEALKGLVNFVSEKQPHLKKKLTTFTSLENVGVDGKCVSVFEDVSIIREALDLLSNNLEDFCENGFKKFVLTSEI